MSENDCVGYRIQVVEASGKNRLVEHFLKKSYKDPGDIAHRRAASLAQQNPDCSTKVFAVTARDLPEELRD